jgi:hypothetical protein
VKVNRGGLRVLRATGLDSPLYPPAVSRRLAISMPQVRIRASDMAGFWIDQVNTAAKSASHRVVKVIVRRVRMIRTESLHI